jgi:hypothetical protein
MACSRSTVEGVFCVLTAGTLRTDHIMTVNAKASSYRTHLTPTPSGRASRAGGRHGWSVVVHGRGACVRGARLRVV